MAALGPFEARPDLAVAVSGGADSLALCLFADRWVRARGGRLVALTVDHGLRPGSRQECATLARWLGGRGIEHDILTWKGAKPAAGIQAAAREARYSLLHEACRERGILHLLLAHHAADQAETVLLRAGAGSGFDGLAAMPAVSGLEAPRRLRPLLGIDPVRLRASLAALGQDWIEDPSNRDRRYTRVRVRAGLGADFGRWAARARRIGRIRAADEAITCRWLARNGRIAPWGHVALDGAALAAAPPAVRIRALGRALLCAGGRAYPPRREALERLAAWAASPDGTRTLGGCRVTRAASTILICRELRGLPELALAPGARALWDGRFGVQIGAGLPDGVSVRALGRRKAEALGPGPAGVPLAARAALPALWSQGKPLAVPYLEGAQEGRIPPAAVRFRPRNPLISPYFEVALAPFTPI